MYEGERMDVPDVREDFNAGTLRLALENGYPVLTPSGTFVPDARAAWLVKAVEAEQVARQVSRNDPGWFHASSLGKPDEELVALYRGEAPYEPFDARKLRVFDVGHNRDGAWKRYIQEAGITIAEDGHREMRLPWLRLRGECDEIVYDPHGRLTLIEIKTKAQHLFAKLGEPDPDHFLQVHAYMGGMGIHQAIILYEAKNDQSLRAFYVPFDGGVWDTIVQRLRRLRAVAEGDASAERDNVTPMIKSVK